MSWIHKAPLVRQHAADVRIAHVVAKKLRAMGYVVQWYDSRDIHKARTHPVNLRCNGIDVLVRRLGALSVGIDAEYLATHTNAYMQRGGVDLTELIAKLEAMSKPHWNT